MPIRVHIRRIVLTEIQVVIDTEDESVAKARATVGPDEHVSQKEGVLAYSLVETEFPQIVEWSKE